MTDIEFIYSAIVGDLASGKFKARLGAIVKMVTHGLFL